MTCCILSFQAWNIVTQTQPTSHIIIKNPFGEFWRLPLPLQHLQHGTLVDFVICVQLLTICIVKIEGKTLGFIINFFQTLFSIFLDQLAYIYWKSLIQINNVRPKVLHDSQMPPAAHISSLPQCLHWGQALPGMLQANGWAQWGYWC